MLTKPLLNTILADDALTRGLGDDEARMLVEWLVEEAERLAGEADEPDAAVKVRKLCRRGRAIGRFVGLWCHSQAPGAAGQLAVAERFTWPLPPPMAEPCEIMHTILSWESSHSHHSPSNQ